MATLDATKMPIDSSFFMFEITGMTTVVFQEVRGLRQEVEIVSMMQRSDKGRAMNYRTVGQLHPSVRVTGVHGMTSDMALDTWMQDTISKGSKTTTKAATVMMFDASGTPTASWSLEGVLLASLQVDSAGMDQNAHVMVTAEFDVAAIKRTK